MDNHNQICGELILKKKGWPVFFILLSIAFVALNLVYKWMESTYAIVIGVVVILLCLARIIRISKINAFRKKAKPVVCCKNFIKVRVGKKEYIIFNFHKKIARVEAVGKHGVKISCNKNASFKVKKINQKKKDWKRTKKPIKMKLLKNNQEVVAFIEQQIALANQPAPAEVAVSDVDSANTEVALEVPASLEELIATNKLPVVVALMMHPEANASFPIPACPMVHAPIAEPVPQKILPELPAEPPVTAYEKLLYNKILWLRGDITEYEKNYRNEIIYHEEFPELYGGKAKKLATKSK